MVAFEATEQNGTADYGKLVPSCWLQLMACRLGCLLLAACAQITLFFVSISVPSAHCVYRTSGSYERYYFIPLCMYADLPGGAPTPYSTILNPTTRRTCRRKRQNRTTVAGNRHTADTGTAVQVVSYTYIRALTSYDICKLS